MTLQEQYKNAVRNGEIFNGGTQCDSWDGPCACGAWHKLTEAETRLAKILPKWKRDVAASVGLLKTSVKLRLVK